MSKVSVFLDTSALIALAGLKETELQIFKRRLKADNIELSVSHIQVDEMSEQVRELQDFKQMSPDQALKSFSEKGIKVSWKEPTMGLVIGISRIGYTRICSEELGKIDDDLRREIKNCMGEKLKDILNIAGDSLIAITSLNHDYFITCDKCLHKSWLKVIEKNMKNRRMLKAQGYKIPRIIYVRPDAKEILEVFVKLSS